MLKIVKRDGRKEIFNTSKIYNAIEKAINSVGGDLSKLDKLALEVVNSIEKKYTTTLPNVENIQDIVEEVLINNQMADVAKSYILYRRERSRIRDQKTRLMQTFKDITFSKAHESDLKRENANINSDTPMGAMLKYGSEGAKEFNKTFVLNPKHTKAHEAGEIHIHDLDFLTMTMTCCQIDLTKLFTNGFQTGHGSVREPQDIKTYAALACIAIQSNQNDQHGGQSVAKFDYDLSQGVLKTYKRTFKKNLKDILLFEEIELNVDEILTNLESDGIIPRLYNETINEHIKTLLPQDKADKILKYVTDKTTKETIRDTHQAMESLVHNLNTMHSRAGAQVPFSSINYGTDTSHEGRLVIESILDATVAGLGSGEKIGRASCRERVW